MTGFTDDSVIYVPKSHEGGVNVCRRSDKKSLYLTIMLRQAVWEDPSGRGHEPSCNQLRAAAKSIFVLEAIQIDTPDIERAFENG